MKKKISVLLCVLVAMLCFTACGSKKENLQYDKSTITQATDFLIEYCNSADADTIEQWNKMTDFQIESQLNQAGVPFTKDSFLAALDAWQQGTKECGEYVSHGDYKFEPSSDELKVTASAKFKTVMQTLHLFLMRTFIWTVQRSMHITASVRSWKKQD